MSRRVIFEDFQEVTGTDLNNIGQFDQDARDAIVADGITNQARYAGCVVSTTGQTSIKVAAGRVYSNGQVFYRDTETPFTLTTYLPAVAGKIATVVVWGTEIDTDLEPRDYIIDVSTGTSEARTGAREHRRALQMDIVYGQESTNPVRGLIGTGIVPVADIILTPTGVGSITMIDTTEVPSGEDNRSAITDLQVFRDTTGKRLDSYATDIANLKAGQIGTVNPTVIYGLQMDVARLKRTVKIPQTNVGYHFDYFEDATYTNLTDPASNCYIDYGVRFPNAAVRYATPALLNSTDTKVSKSGTFILPAWTENKRISVVGNDAQISAADNQYQVTTQVQQSISRSATTYGPTVTTCTNAAEFYTGTYNAATNVLTRNGETFNVTFTGVDYGAPVGLAAGTHVQVQLQQFQTYSWTDTYWTAVTNTYGVNGSICAQTFLNANAGWLVGINLFFSQVDVSAGAVTLSVCKLNSSGQPDFTAVVGNATVQAADLKVYPNPTRFNLSPIFLEAGQRYGLVAITAGHHFFAQTTGNKYAQGSFFNSTDGAWFQGDTQKDLAFEAVYAQFSTARAEIDLQPMQLENGICNVKIITTGKVPDGCSLVYQYKPADANVWTTIADNSAAAPLYNLPALCQLRAVFIGTTDLMPGMDLALGEIKTWRPAGTFTWVSQPFDLGSGVTTTKVTYQVRYEHFDPAKHTVTMQLKGATGSYLAPTTTTIVVDPYDPTARTYTYVWNGLTATQKYTFRADGNTNAVTNNYIISQSFDAAS